MRCWITWRAVWAATRPKSLGVDFDNCHIAKVNFRAQPAGLVKQYFGTLVLDIFDYFFLYEDANKPGFRINFSFDLLGVGGIYCPPISRYHRGFNCRQNDLLRQFVFLPTLSLKANANSFFIIQPAPRNLYYTQKSGGHPLFGAFDIGITDTQRILAYNLKSCKDLIRDIIKVCQIHRNACSTRNRNRMTASTRHCATVVV